MGESVGEWLRDVLGYFIFFVYFYAQGGENGLSGLRMKWAK